MQEKPDIRNQTTNELIDFFKANNEKTFRLIQLEEWLWNKCVNSFDEMTNLPKSMREMLKDNFDFYPVIPEEVLFSNDGTIKTAFRLFDGDLVESVLIPVEGRTTACISTQVGCALGCGFCATGQLKFKRNLTAGEIFDQVVATNGQSLLHSQQRLSNIVVMGMGEPLLNYDNLLKAIDKITSEAGLGFSSQRITVSTSGLSKMIKRLADDCVKFQLALSLHSANDHKRSSIMPINKTNNLKSLAGAVRYFYEKTGSRITFEYLLLKDINDSLQDAAEMAVFCKNVPCKVNLIEYNPVDNSGFFRSSASVTEQFLNFLENKNIIVHVRRSRGSDIDAACGQLANKKSNQLLQGVNKIVRK